MSAHVHAETRHIRLKRGEGSKCEHQQAIRRYNKTISTTGPDGLRGYIHFGSTITQHPRGRGEGEDSPRIHHDDQYHGTSERERRRTTRERGGGGW